MHHQNYPLDNRNSFALAATAKDIYLLNSLQQLQQLATSLPEHFYILGGGSNTLFIEDYQGTVICPEFKGIAVTETDADYKLHVASGENWHQLVQHCLANNMPGLENLALIPGNCGAAPIQNIGAYGVEFADICDYVDWFEFSSHKVRRLSKAECLFAYRDSIFKNSLKNKGVICAVGISLKKQWLPVLKYQGLNTLGEKPTPKQVFDKVIAIRQSKLPDPDILPNAGSFFKNPIVDKASYQALVKQYPMMPAYPQVNGKMKLAAGWLIDQCQLKGASVGGAAVHKLQALVLINENNASGQDIIALARLVKQTVKNKFQVNIEPEVRFITHCGEQQIEDIG
ncbi:UDP-N-acetylmuramate dehydrogenase [Thalassotalea sp. ND16A]|nr:UDP-N-acetylmuramate dehydrogenase [Thalassotalea sp. ND16A]